MTKEAKTYTADDIVHMLHQRFSGIEYIVLHEVADGTGMHQHRWIDVAVFSLWPSKGQTNSVDREDREHV